MTDNGKLHLLTIVVQRRLGDRVLDAALAAGAGGATFFYGQGTGMRQRMGFLGRLIEAEKQIIFVVAEPARADAILQAASRAGNLDKPGHGFAYIQEVVKAVGFTGPHAT